MHVARLNLILFQVIVAAAIVQRQAGELVKLNKKDFKNCTPKQLREKVVAHVLWIKVVVAASHS